MSDWTSARTRTATGPGPLIITTGTPASRSAAFAQPAPPSRVATVVPCHESEVINP
jgi:hypothetical protein